MLYAPKEEIEGRIARLKTLMEKASLDGAFFLYKVDYYYFTGTMQDAFLFVPLKGKPILFVRREINRARKESPLEEVIPVKAFNDIKPYINGIKRCGFELDVVPYNLMMKFMGILGNIELVDISPIIKCLRKTKTPFEIFLMEKAASIAKKVYKKIPDVLKEGMTEIELGGLLESFAKPLGHEGILRVRSLNYEAYSWHILSGETGSIVSQSDSPMGGLGLSPAFPVGASMKKIRKGEPILIDYGVCYHGYQADQTRMFAIGHMPDIFVKAYEVCRDVHYKVLDKALTGMTCSALFEYSKELAKKAGFKDAYLGYGPYQVKFLAHGIGLELNEIPFIATGMDYPIEEGMVFAIEPKMVFPKIGASGIENTVVIEKGKWRVLTDINEEIVIL